MKTAIWRISEVLNIVLYPEICSRNQIETMIAKLDNKLVPYKKSMKRGKYNTIIT